MSRKQPYFTDISPKIAIKIGTELQFHLMMLFRIGRKSIINFAFGNTNIIIIFSCITGSNCKKS